MVAHTTLVSTQVQKNMAQQAPFKRVAPLLGAAVLIGPGGGFALATVLTLTPIPGLVVGPWWLAVAQAHGHLQLYGWAGLFVMGVALHFVPRLRGSPLAMPYLIPWILSALVVGLVLRALCQPLVTISSAVIWQAGLLASGVLECAAVWGIIAMIALTLKNGPALAQRPAFRGVFPFIVGAFVALGLASIINVISVSLAVANAGIVNNMTDALNVALGLLGFLLPMALAMSAQSLPMYAGLDAFPRKVLWPLAGLYFAGLLLFCTETLTELQPNSVAGPVGGVGMLLIGVVLLIFTSLFLHLMRKRGRLPRRVADLAPQPQTLARSYTTKIAKERNAFGPFVGIIASAYLWAILAGLLLVSDGVALLTGFVPPFALDAIRHSLAVGFIALLICGIAPRMITGFSGGRIVSPRLVTATLWLGNAAALLRVGAILAASLLSSISIAGISLYAIVFGLSGPTGLALAVCLTINLWPALRSPLSSVDGPPHSA
jgi:uncharacterized protein involved in response to NO